MGRTNRNLYQSVLYDPFGFDLIKAAKAGSALFLSDLDGFKEVWSESALYFDAENEDNLINGLEVLIENDFLRKKYLQKAQEQVKKLKPAVFGDAYYSLYKQLYNQEAESFNLLPKLLKA